MLGGNQALPGCPAPSPGLSHPPWMPGLPPGLSGGHQEAFHSCPRLVAMAVSVGTTPARPLQLCPQDGRGGREGHSEGRGARSCAKARLDSPRFLRTQTGLARDPGPGKQPSNSKAGPLQLPVAGTTPPPAASRREVGVAHVNPKGLFQEPTLPTPSHSASTPRDGNRRHFRLHYFFQDLYLY